ncbi:MAG TPA: threonine/serine dehydratase [Vicinamibacterales bacterium]
MTITDVQAAADRIRSTAWKTPLVPSPWLSDIARASVWLKLETVQATGSYKIRGATNALARLKAARPDVATVITASAGNHGQAVALAASALGVRARIYLPKSAPDAKRRAMARLGADIVEVPTYDAAEAQAHDEAQRNGAVYVSPYNDADVIAGAGTVALEMFDERPELDTLIVPLGGGGLLSGTAIVARARAPRSLIVGTEAAASPVFTGALAAGRPVTVEVHDTLADGLAGNMDADSMTFGVVRDLVDRVIAVPEPDIAAAMRDLILKERLVAEGASATAVAAILGGLDLSGRHVGVILSGRNVDAHIIARVLS